MGLADNQTIGSIVIEERLETGGGGEVYLGRQPGLDRDVFVRKLRRELLGSRALVDRVLGSPTLADRLQREARFGAAVSHPNVVQIYDFFGYHGDHFLVLERVDGCDLRTALARAGRVPTRVAMQIALDLARALTEIHARRIIHADLSPSRVLLLP